MNWKQIGSLTLGVLLVSSIAYGAEQPLQAMQKTSMAEPQENMKMPASTKDRLTQQLKNRQASVKTQPITSKPQAGSLQPVTDVQQIKSTHQDNPKAKRKVGTAASKMPPQKKGLLEIRKVPIEDKGGVEAKKSKKGKSVSKQAFEERAFFGETMLPRDYQNISIFGANVATMSQASIYLRKNNPKIKLVCSPERLIEYYWEEAAREGVRGDLALCQAIVETGFFKYGGDVVYQQNNFCGLGTTGGGVRGAKFKTPQLGVRAHIQHLLAYSRKSKPKTAIVDPRYEVAHNLRVSRGIIDKWSGLNGTWAMGAEYCEKIMSHYVRMLDVKNERLVEKNNDKKLTMRERLNRYKKR